MVVPQEYVQAISPVPTSGSFSEASTWLPSPSCNCGHQLRAPGSEPQAPISELQAVATSSRLRASEFELRAPSPEPRAPSPEPRAHELPIPESQPDRSTTPVSSPHLKTRRKTRLDATADPTQSQTRCKTRPDAKPQNQNPKPALFRGQVHPTARSKLPRHATINPTHPRIQHGRTLSSRIDSHPSFPYDPHIASPRLEPLYCSHSFPSFWLPASGCRLPAAGCRQQAASSWQRAAGSSSTNFQSLTAAPPNVQNLSSFLTLLPKCILLIPSSLQATVVGTV